MFPLERKEGPKGAETWRWASSGNVLGTASFSYQDMGVYGGSSKAEKLCWSFVSTVRGLHRIP